MVATAVDRAAFDAMKGPLQRALFFAGGTHTLDDVWDAIEAGKAQMWLGPRSIVVTEIHVSPQQRTVHWWLAGGVMEELAAMERGILAWAKSEGCTRATLAGRKGWERAWSTRNWRPTLTVMERGIP